MQAGKLEQLVALIDQAVGELGVHLDLKDVEAMAVMIHRTMTAQARSYHTLDHLFPLAKNAGPIRTLAALFHDLVYFQVDHGIPFEIDELLAPHIAKGVSDGLIIQPADPDDPLCRLAMGLFGLESGDELSPAAGLNEFLSALYLSLRLGQGLEQRALARIIVCIEATIPFRGPDVQGVGAFERLAMRLAAVNRRHGLELSRSEQTEAIQDAVRFANMDVSSFAEADPGRFLDDTWLLLPETNAALRSGEVYSIRDYRRALQKVGAFLNFLDPDLVFHQYQNVPAEEEYEVLRSLAWHNINTARDYVGVKLLAMAVIEALAEISGGDAPLALFMGDFRRTESPVKRLEEFLPVIDTPPELDASPVGQLLELGRSSESIFDVKNSPTAHYLRSSLGPDEVKRLLPLAEAMFAGSMAVQSFLDEIDGDVVASIAEAAGQMVSTRQKRLSEYARSRR